MPRDEEEELAAPSVRELVEVRAREQAYRRRIEQERDARSVLRQHQRRIYELLRTRSPSRDGIARTLSEVASISREALGVERVSVWLFDEQSGRLDCLMLSVRGAERPPGGLSLDARQFPEYMKSLLTSDVVAVEDARNDRRTAGLDQYLRETRVCSLLDIPIHAPLSLVGVLCHEHVGDELRRWSEEEQDFARSVGDLSALALEAERRARAERVAQGTELKYQHLVEALPVVVYSFDAHTGRVDYVSPKIREFSSLGPTDWLAKQNIDDWVAQIHEADRGLVLDRLRADLGAGLPPEIEYRVHAVDGTERWIRDTCAVVRDPRGHAVAIQGTLADVTEQRRAERSRAEYEHRFQLLFENPELIGVILDLEGRIQFASEGFLTKTGLFRSEALGADCFDLVVPEPERAALRRAFLSDTRREQLARLHESGLLSKTGAARRVQWANTILRGDDGSMTGTASIGVDVTERWAREVEQAEEQKLQTLGMLSASVAHDFNNLLMVIGAGLAELRSDPNGKDAPEKFGLLDRAVRDATELTRSLLSYGRRRGTEPVAIPVDRFVLDSRPLLRAMLPREIELATRLDAASAEVQMESTGLHQILVNLVANAGDATRGVGSRVVVRTFLAQVSDRDASAHGGAHGGSFVALQVSDDGIGMSAELRSRIFEPFFSTKGDAGTGLGLASVRAAVVRARGFLELESEPSQGTTFRVFLPVVSARAEGPATSSLARPRRAGLVRVLVVEDIPQLRRVFRMTLDAAGYDVVSVQDVKSALEAILLEPPDIVLTDWTLPDGHAHALIRAARAARSETRIIVCSGSPDATAVGADAFLPKPFALEEMLRLVKSVTPPRVEALNR